MRVEKLGDSADALQAIMGNVVKDAEAQGVTKDIVSDPLRVGGTLFGV